MIDEMNWILLFVVVSPTYYHYLSYKL